MKFELTQPQHAVVSFVGDVLRIDVFAETDVIILADLYVAKDTRERGLRLRRNVRVADQQQTVGTKGVLQGHARDGVERLRQVDTAYLRAQCRIQRFDTQSIGCQGLRGLHG